MRISDLISWTLQNQDKAAVDSYNLLSSPILSNNSLNNLFGSNNKIFLLCIVYGSDIFYYFSVDERPMITFLIIFRKINETKIIKS